MPLSLWQKLLAISLSWLLLACSSSNTAPVTGVGPSPTVTQSPQSLRSESYYIVQKGDTLYSIAFKSGNDVPTLANYNNIAAPLYIIHPGQRIMLNASSTNMATARRSAGSYVVRQGDTLSSIGRQFALSPQILAHNNNLQAPYIIHVGQTINVQGTTGAVASTGSVAKAPTTLTATAQSPIKRSDDSPFVPKKPVANQAPKEYINEPATKVQQSDSRLVWLWPAEGNIIARFSVAEQGNKGIDIAGKRGQAVYAASSGKVVYAGSALRGYGKLIILKHDDDYLTAYAHNDQLLVNEGDSVKGGAVIAKMGSSDAPDVRLHFEIRYRGKSVDPMRYLPAR